MKAGGHCYGNLTGQAAPHKTMELRKDFSSKADAGGGPAAGAGAAGAVRGGRGRGAPPDARGGGERGRGGLPFAAARTAPR